MFAVTETLKSWHLLDPLIWWMLCFLLFGLLARLSPNIPGQPVWRRGMGTDILYYFLTPLVNGRLQIMLVVAVLIALWGEDEQKIEAFLHQGGGPLAEWPILWQALLVLLLSDIMMYGWHRFFHTSHGWDYHAIHHSSTTLDWLSANRFHPVNSWVSFVFTSAIVMLLGFKPLVFVLLAPFNILMNALVHANLNWTFGPFKYVLASPVFHRWHHTLQDEARDKNFAPTFPFIDMLFGTFYMPKGKLPERFGVDGNPVPEGFIGQMLYPFRRK